VARVTIYAQTPATTPNHLEYDWRTSLTDPCSIDFLSQCWCWL